MADPGRDDHSLPVSWDEARELLVVALLAVTVMYLLSPVADVFDGRGTPLGDDLHTLTRSVGPTSGLFLLAAGTLIATTPPDDVVPRLRSAVAVLATVVVAMGVVAITVTLTRPSAGGVLTRLETVFARSGPGLTLAAMAGWLARRVIPFPPGE